MEGKMRKKCIIKVAALLIILFTCFLAGPAGAEIVWDYSPDATGAGVRTSWYTNQIGSQQLAEKIVFSDSTALGGMDIYSYIDAGEVGQLVKIYIWSDNDGVPGALLYEFEETINIIDNKGTISQEILSRKHADFSTPVDLAAGIYWIAMTSATVGVSLGQATLDAVDDDRFAWCHSGLFSGMSSIGTGDMAFRLHGVQSQATWLIDTVDGGKCFTGGSMALDADGHPHIVYGGDHLYHAYYDGSTWHEEMIDSAAGVGEYANIVIAPNGDIHVLYWDYVKDNQQLSPAWRYATNAGGVWKNQAHPLSSSSWPQMFVDASGTVHLIYRTGDFLWTDQDVAHVSGTYGNWTASQIVAGGTGYFTSCLDGSGNLHLFYGSDYYLHHRSWSAGAWTAPEVVDDYSDGKHEPSPYSCTVDADGYLHILHKIWPWVRYATNRSGSWQAETVEGVWNGGCSGVITTDAAGQVHIAYGGSDDCRNLRYATGNFGNWNIETADTLSADGRWDLGELSIQLEAGGAVHLNYIDRYTMDLKHAVRSGGSWSVDTVAENAEDSSMVIDSANRVHLSYYDSDAGAIIYAINSGGGWISETIASDSVDVPVGGALTTDLSGNSHMVYIDRAKHIMKYAKGQYGQWQIETFDVAESWWTTPSLATDSTDSLHVAYIAQVQLRYATNRSGNMEVETLMDAGGRWPALILDGNDRVHIVARDNDSQLIYFTNESGAWESQVLSTLSVSALGGLQTDASGALHVVYGADDGTLYHLTNASGAWQTSEIGNPGTTYLYSIYFTIDTAGSVHVTYDFYSEATENYYLGYATDASGSWELTSNVVENAEPEAIYVNAVGQVCIVWLNDDTYQILGCAVKDGSTWTNETIDQTDLDFSNVNVSTDGSGTLHLSYSDGFEAIKYAKGMPGDWTVETIENTIAYSWNDIAVDALGKVHIAYREFGNRNLKYATTAFSGSQDNVFDFPAYDGQSQLMLESPEGTRIESVEPVGNPSSVNTPEGIEFPYGFVRFAITGVEEEGSLVVTLTLEEGAIVNTYYKYGPTLDNPEPHWYEFLFDGTTGAVISGNIITLHFVDGQRGDYDLTANGVIIDPGAPGFGGIPGDLDGDCDVDFADYSIFRLSLGKCDGQGGYNPDADYDGDGCISYADFRIWYGYYRDFQQPG